MAMVFLTSKGLSQHCLLLEHHDHHHHLYQQHQGQLRFSLRETLQDGYKCELIQRRPILEPLCQAVLRNKDVNQSNISYEKAFGTWLLRTCNYSDYKAAVGSNLSHKTAGILCDARGQITWEQPGANARIFASLDPDGGKTDGARKALEQAFQGKNNVAKKWEEEIRKRELAGNDGGGSSGGWGEGGGGGGGDEEMGEGFGEDEPWNWEEAGQTFMATFALIILYFSITHGPKQVFRLFKLFFRYIRQGFRLRKIPDEYLLPEGPEDDSDEDYLEGGSDDDFEDDFVPGTQAVSNARKGDVQKNHSPSDEAEEDEDDEIYDVPTPPAKPSKINDKVSRLRAEQQDKILQQLTPKELRQLEEKK
eukprot:c6273_g1_i1 orf=164-1252(+)